MKQIRSEYLGTCPNCDSIDLTYAEERIFEGNQLYMEFVCDDCGAKGKEWYEVKPLEIVVEEIKGQKLEEE